MDEEVFKKESETRNITIEDIADALGISKTTVSRAISGKGRIGEATRTRVMEYVDVHGYKPHRIAKSMARQKTFNIGWVMPGDVNSMDLPFFQSCVIGISEVASEADYDVVISIVQDDDMSSLERLIRHKKVDGVILGRTLVHDARVAFLKQSDVPFVVIGSSPFADVIQIDNDHIAACKELTTILYIKGLKRMMLIGGDEEQVVNQTRRDGFYEGMQCHGFQDQAIREMIHMNADNDVTISRLVDQAIREDYDCIVCTDDKICLSVLNKLRKDGISIPLKIKVASFYNNDMLSNYRPPITSLQYDPKELGREAARQLLAYIDGQEVSRKKLLGYELLLKASTQI